jgi:hypothetical protein
MQEVKHSINSLILFGVKKNCLISRRRPLLYQFTRWAIKLTVLIINFIQNYIQYPSLNVKPNMYMKFSVGCLLMERRTTKLTVF